MSNLKAYHYDGFNTDTIRHGFYTRLGGVSEGIYAGLNAGQGSDDSAALVAENRAAVAADLGADVSVLLAPYQIHSSTCHILSLSEERPQGDALATDQAGLVLSIVTADCAPVLLQGEKSSGAPVIAAAHAGWKGAFGEDNQNVLSNSVKAMLNLGAELSSIKAVIGPCIAKKSYEVDLEFYKRFVMRDEMFETFFGAGSRADHFQFDLEGFCTLQLAQAGIQNIHAMGLDTYSNDEEFYSYRRTTHAGEPDYGRQISAIVINN